MMNYARSRRQRELDQVVHLMQRWKPIKLIHIAAYWEASVSCVALLPEAQRGLLSDLCLPSYT
jgi:hypothetical protein